MSPRVMSLPPRQEGQVYMSETNAFENKGEPAKPPQDLSLIHI